MSRDSTSSTKVFVHGNPEVDAIWSLLVAELEQRGVDDIVLLSPRGSARRSPDGWVGRRRRLPGLADRRTGDGSVPGAGDRSRRPRLGCRSRVRRRWPHAPTSSGRSPPTASGCSTPTTCGTTWRRPGRHPRSASRSSSGMVGAPLADRRDVLELRCARRHRRGRWPKAPTRTWVVASSRSIDRRLQPATARIGRAAAAADTSADAGDHRLGGSVRVSRQGGRGGRRARRGEAPAGRVRSLVDVRGAGPGGRRARGVLVETRSELEAPVRRRRWRRPA